MSTRKKYLSNDINSIVRSIDFAKLVQYFQLPPFPLIFPRYEITFQFLVTTSIEEIKNEFVRYCLERDEKEFVALLLHSGQYTAAHMIEPTTLDIIDDSRLHPNGNRIISNCPYIDLDPKRDKIKTQEIGWLSSDLYSMTRSPRGFCLLINNYLTFGTFEEIQRLRNIFYQLHFEVIVEKNLTAQEIMQKFHTLSTDPRLAYHDAFACYIISHGTKEGEIFGFDFERLCMKKMCQKFDDNHCPQLIRKPKIFFFNCCRGNVRPTDANNFDNPSQPLLPQIPRIKDMLICYSTLDGYTAAASWHKCTEFGAAFCDTLVEYAWNKNMSSLLTRTNGLLHDKQPFNWENAFKHTLSFRNPSHPIDAKQLPLP